MAKNSGVRVKSCKGGIEISIYTGGCKPDMTSAMDRLIAQVFHHIRKN